MAEGRLAPAPGPRGTWRRRSIVDTHEAANAWIVVVGSGHGYRLGPALGEQKKEPFFRLSRFR